MLRLPEQLDEDAIAIWKAGVAAVDSKQLVVDNVAIEQRTLLVGAESIDLANVRQIVVVGAGKAGAGMAEGIEHVLGESLMAEKKLTGWINVPDDCVRSLSRITLHGARPAGVNEPTPAGRKGAERILQAVRDASSADLCICLISGGGSALLPAPVEGISLADKLAITKHLSGAGANIQQLNTVRKQLSRIKGGGLAESCRAGRILTLIISDVIGDPLDVIASGPTVEDRSTPGEALSVLETFGAASAGISQAVFQSLRAKASNEVSPTGFPCRVSNIVIGNNATAVDAAGREAERRGYSHAMVAANSLEGRAEGVGQHLAEMALSMRSEPGPDCLISGGEPVVELVAAEQRGKGGRNQQLILAALEHLFSQAPDSDPADAVRNMMLLSGGTDGEDGPTDAAGAMINAEIAEGAGKRGLAPAEFLARNDAYHFFEPLGALIRTGPTHTNVCDLRVVVVNK